MSLLAQHRAGPWGRSQQKGRIYPGARCKGQGRLASQTGHLFTDRRLCLKSKGRTGGQMGSQEETAEFKESGCRLSDFREQRWGGGRTNLSVLQPGWLTFSAAGT